MEDFQIRTNRLMSDYLKKISFNFEDENTNLPFELGKIINGDFLTENECIILKDIYKNNSNPKFEKDLAKCEWEYSENHFHPDDYIDNISSELDYLYFALCCSKELAKRLSLNFPNINFRIIVSFCETQTDKNGEVEYYGSSTVRFYKIRPECESKMKTSNLDDFEQDAILEIELD